VTAQACHNACVRHVAAKSLESPPTQLIVNQAEDDAESATTTNSSHPLTAHCHSTTAVQQPICRAIVTAMYISVTLRSQHSSDQWRTVVSTDSVKLLETLTLCHNCKLYPQRHTLLQAASAYSSQTPNHIWHLTTCSACKCIHGSGAPGQLGTAKPTHPPTQKQSKQLSPCHQLYTDNPTLPHTAYC
jgi:hypothetical protein